MRRQLLHVVKARAVLRETPVDLSLPSAECPISFGAVQACYMHAACMPSRRSPAQLYQPSRILSNDLPSLPSHILKANQ